MLLIGFNYIESHLYYNLYHLYYIILICMINKNKGLTPLFLYKMIIWLVKKSHENVIFLCSDKNAGSEIKDKK